MTDETPEARMVDVEISRERWEQIKATARQIHERHPERSPGDCYWDAVNEHVRVLPNLVVEDTVMGGEDVFGEDAIDAEWRPEDGDGDDLRTDGGVNRRDVLKAAGASVALGTLPGVTSPTSEQAEGEESGLTEELLREVRRDEELTVRTHAYVDLPEATWDRAVERATRAGAVGTLEDYLLDYFTLEFAFVVDGDVRLRTGGFDPRGVTVHDGETTLDIRGVYGDVHPDVEPVVDLSDVHGDGGTTDRA